MKETDLWVALHDADLVRATSDRHARTVTLEVEIEHIREFEGLPPQTRWVIVLVDAAKVTARRWESWPGPAPDLDGMTREQGSDAVREYQEKGRTESIDWNDFEQIATRDRIWLKAAHLLESENEVTLSGYGHDRSKDRYFELSVTGRRIECRRSDAAASSIASMLEAGERYWQDFEKREPK